MEGPWKRLCHSVVAVDPGALMLGTNEFWRFACSPVSRRFAAMVIYIRVIFMRGTFAGEGLMLEL